MLQYVNIKWHYRATISKTYSTTVRHSLILNWEGSLKPNIFINTKTFKLLTRLHFTYIYICSILYRLKK